jgi:tRNA pseudouridine13 synthase
MGHLRGNRFRLLIRGAHDLEAARAVLSQLERDGVPNYYGDQRFGIGERNVERAYAMLTGQARPPRDHFERKLLMSALQSALFNVWLAQRVTDGLYAQPLPGDLLRKESSGGLFINDDQVEAERRMREWEISATGPMFGSDMPEPQGEAAARERTVFERSGLTASMLAEHKSSGAGTRRAARVRLADCHVTAEPEGLRLVFQLPAGAYATTVLREVMKPDVEPAPGHRGGHQGETQLDTSEAEDHEAS